MTTSQTEKSPSAWVWHSTDASIEAGQISVLAVAEVFAAVGLYWWLSMHFEWPWFSMVGLIAAPMLLLRSPESIELGVEMLHRHIEIKSRRSWKWKPWKVWSTVLIILITGLATALLTHYLALVWLPEYIGWALFWRAAVLSAVVITVAVVIAIFIAAALVAGAFAVAAKDVGLSWIVGGLNAIRAVVVAFMGASAGAFIGVGVGVGVAAGAIVGVIVGVIVGAIMGAVTFLGLIRYSSHSDNAVVPTFFILLYSPGFALGTLLVAIFIRLAATLRHPLLGLRQSPSNWREILMVIDLTHPPELLPQAGRVHEVFTVSSLWRNMADTTSTLRSFTAFLIIAWYLPALAYRWSLKGSAWLWWPLALALTPPLQGLDGPASRVRAAHITSGAWAFSLWVPVVWLLLLVLLRWPGIKLWLKLLPEYIHTIIEFLASNLTAPSIGLIYGLLWLVPVLALVLWWQRKNLVAAYGNMLTSPNEFSALSPEEQASFLKSVARLDRLRLWLIATLLLLGEAFALTFAHSKDPEYVERLVWPCLLAWL